MKVDDVWLWEFSAEPSDTCSIKCPECGEVSPLSDWNESEVSCEDCGSHSAMQCPRCDERFDHVFGPTFQVVP